MVSMLNWYDVPNEESKCLCVDLCLLHANVVLNMFMYILFILLQYEQPTG